MTLHETIHLQIPKMHGWVSPERGCELADLIVQNRPGNCVEIGTFGGRSCISQALALKQNNYGVIYAIDPWRPEPAMAGENDANKKWWSEVDLNDIHKSFVDYVWNVGVQDFVVPMRATSRLCANLFSRIRIDMLVIDGNHSEESSLSDVQLYVPRVVPGGIVYFDDTDWPSTKKAVAMLDEKCELVKDAGTYRIYRKL